MINRTSKINRGPADESGRDPEEGEFEPRKKPVPPNIIVAEFFCRQSSPEYRKDCPTELHIAPINRSFSVARNDESDNITTAPAMQS